MTFEIVPAAEVPLAEQARLANEAFAGYVGGWAEMDANVLARFLMLQGTDLFYSRFVRADDRLVGFGYINHTGKILRLSGMAMVPEARGTGAAVHLLERLCADGKARSNGAMMLEVIEQNPRAVAFYRRHKFKQLTRLSGWRCAANATGIQHGSERLDEISIVAASSMRWAYNYPELPWQISRHAILKIERASAFLVGDACIVVSDSAAGIIRVHALLSISLDGDELRDALGGVMRRWPDREFSTSPIWPEEFGVTIFEPLGFTREPLTQFLMRRSL